MQNERSDPQPVDQPLGEPLRVFRARFITRAVVALCGIILLGGGIACFTAFTKLFASTLLTLGIMVLALAYVMGKSKYLVCPRGIIKDRFGYQQLCRWDDIGEIIDLHSQQGIVADRLCALVKKNGSRVVLHNLGIDDFPAMLEFIRLQAETRGIPWKEERIVK